MDVPPSGYSYQGPQPAMPKTSSMAIIALISGILGWMGFFGIGGLAAVIFGHVAKNEIRKGNGWVTGDGMATAGLVLGYTNIAATVLFVCFFLILPLVIAGAAAPACMLPFINNVTTSFSTIP